MAAGKTVADPGGAEVAGGAARVRTEEVEGEEERRCCGGKRGKREKRLRGWKKEKKRQPSID